jgi:hypothetical protein
VARADFKKALNDNNAMALTTPPTIRDGARDQTDGTQE